MTYGDFNDHINQFRNDCTMQKQTMQQKYARKKKEKKTVHHIHWMKLQTMANTPLVARPCTVWLLQAVVCGRGSLGRLKHPLGGPAHNPPPGWPSGGGWTRTPNLPGQKLGLDIYGAMQPLIPITTQSGQKLQETKNMENHPDFPMFFLPVSFVQCTFVAFYWLF